MAIQILHPTSNGTNNAWSLGAGADKPTAVATDDGDTTYIYETGGLITWQGFVMAACTLDGATTINGVTVKAVVKPASSPSNIQFSYFWRGAQYKGTLITGLPASWSTVETEYATNPRTSAAWTVANLNDGFIQWEIRYGGNSNEMRDTEMWIEVDYVSDATAVPLVNGGLVNAGLVGGRLIR